MNKKGKSIITTCFCMLFVFAMCTTVIAAENTYVIDELGIEITVPVGYSTITRYTPDIDPVFSDFGTTKSEMMQLFNDGDIYLNSLSEVYNEEIVVTMVDSAIGNFCLLPDETLYVLATAMVDEFEDYGINIFKYEVYQHVQGKFLKLYFVLDDNSVHGLQYYTIYDGKAMNITLRSYDGEISSRQESTIASVVNSIKFKNDPPTTVPEEDTPSFCYIDKDSGVSFIVPNNWKEEPLSQKREFVDTKFISTKNVTNGIIFGSYDLWSALPHSEKAGMSRKDFDISVLTKTDIAEMYGTSVGDVSIVTYNKRNYYKYEGRTSTELYGFNFSTNTVALIYAEDGWLYLFTFSGDSTNPLYSDFETLLCSVEYPSDSEDGDNLNATQGSIDDTQNDSDYNAPFNTGIFIVIGFVVISVLIIVIVLRYPGNKNTEAQRNYCRRCVKELPLNSAFCPYCGTKIFNEEKQK